MPGKGTPRQAFRVEPSLWETFGVAAALTGSDRATVLREFMRWFIRERGAKMPVRPAAAELEAGLLPDA
jgi:hypothetical protein